MAFIRRHPFLPDVGIGLVGCFVVAGVVQATGLADDIATVLQPFAEDDTDYSLAVTLILLWVLVWLGFMDDGGQGR